jgi:hypothetical protein
MHSHCLEKVTHETLNVVLILSQISRCQCSIVRTRTDSVAPRASRFRPALIATTERSDGAVEKVTDFAKLIRADLTVRLPRTIAA